MNRQPKTGTRFWQIRDWNIRAIAAISAVRYRVDGEAAPLAAVEAAATVGSDGD